MTFTIGEQPVEGTDLLKRVTVGLVTMICYATMAAVASFFIEEGPVGETGIWKRISRGLVSTFRCMFLVAMIHYLWLMLGNSLFVAPAPSYVDGEVHSLGGMTSAEDGSALNAGPAAKS